MNPLGRPTRTTEQFIEDCKKVHGDKYDYSKLKFENIMKPVLIICKEHGEFIQIANIHLNSKSGCKKCSYKGRIYKKHNRIRGVSRGSLVKKVYSTGYIGFGNYSCTEKGKITKCYAVWSSMLERAYSEKWKIKYPSYLNVSVCEDWHNYQNFAKWFHKNYRQGFALDKDILVRGNKIYSAETCCFVPPQINNLFLKREKGRGECLIGVSKHYKNYMSEVSTKNGGIYLGTFKTEIEAFTAYKEAKEKNIKEVANEWKSEITQDCYNALVNYKIEIYD